MSLRDIFEGFTIVLCQTFTVIALPAPRIGDCGHLLFFFSLAIKPHGTTNHYTSESVQFPVPGRTHLLRHLR